jgi:hypothetical protein
VLFSRLLSSGKVAVQFDNDSHYATYYFNHHWLAGGSAWHAGRVFTLAADDAVYPACRLVLARSSPRFHHWLLYRSWFGGYLRHWQKHRAMPPGAKPRAIAVILITFAISLWLVKMMWYAFCCWRSSPACFSWRDPVVDEKQQKH